MDIFAHGLWAAAAAKGLNKGQRKRRINVWAMALWGMFPDLLAFAIPFIWIVGSVALGTHSFAEFSPGHAPVSEPAGSDTLWIFQFSHAFYNVGHSLIIFTIVFFGVWAYFKQARLELLGWLLHILMDVPTHTYAFFPTPVFWPLFDWKFDGFAWGTPWFMVLNYSLLLLVFALLAMKHRTHPEKTN
ncbi:MAG: hypothetical protein AAB628_02445 [Patescibacteria group bacterium]